MDDHSEPLPELRRLIAVARAYGYSSEAERIMRDESLGEGRFRAAQEKFEQALSLAWAMPGNMELVFWGAAGLTSAGRLDDALPLFRQAFDADPSWRDLVPRLVVAGRLPDVPEMIARIRSA